MNNTELNKELNRDIMDNLIYIITKLELSIKIILILVLFLFDYFLIQLIRI